MWCVSSWLHSFFSALGANNIKWKINCWTVLTHTWWKGEMLHQVGLRVSIINIILLFSYQYSIDACLTVLYVMSFTSGLAYANTADHHNIELLYNGSVLTMTLYVRPGITLVSWKGDKLMFWRNGVLHAASEINPSTFCTQCLKHTHTFFFGWSAIVGTCSNNGWNVKKMCFFIFFFTFSPKRFEGFWCISLYICIRCSYIWRKLTVAI